MASATVTGSSDPRAAPGRAPAKAPARGPGRALRLPLARSRLGRTILGLNLLGLAILIVGALVFNEFRRGLVEARVDSLSTQGQLIAYLLEEGATAGDPAPAMDWVRAGEILRFMHIPASERARLYDPRGRLIVDTDIIADKVLTRPLPPAHARGAWRPPWAETDEARELKAHGQEQAEIRAALAGATLANLRRSESGGRVISVSIPLQHVQAVLGVLTLESGDVAATVAKQRAALIPFIAIAVLVILTSSLLINVMVARPVVRLARAADSVRLARARALSLPDVAARADEVGDLARSLDAMTTALTTRMDAIESFAADVSHEIKNPLTSIRSAVETLEMNPPEPGRARLLGILKHDVGRLDRLITDISSASRLDAELSREAPRPVDLGRMMRDMGEAYDGVRPRVVVTVEPGALLALGRQGPLGQVFRNLVDNARSFSPPDGVVRVTVDRARLGDGGAVRVAVEDEGPGVPEGDLEQVFERFYTNRPRGAPGGGVFGGHSGLGLAIARQIVEAHGGTIVANNRAGSDGAVRGARFVVTLPEAPA